MGVSTFTQEYKCPIAPPRMFKALVVDSNNLFPKLFPQIIKSVNVIQGDGGAAGSIEQVNFTEGNFSGTQFKYVKHRIDEIDEKNLVCKYTMIEGDALGDKLESIVYEVKFEADSDGGGCICKMTSHYHMVGEFEIRKEEIEAGKDKVAGIYKIVENYLLDNPQVYA
ncbi:hypothetical protein Patl1_24971 [Pistacia atlantica]|uniref:Uncharacterized protein n=1 Tax=Pistacia atlantica TaxID=434234 RepID=A0ACC1AZG1_9ROSI|nr:hypothetical protein Patl1_24971 [Pistacia atlantica]